MGDAASRGLWRAGVLGSAVLAVLNLLAGISGGLARLGWATPAAGLQAHGALMVCGFFGCLIALERAVALHRLPGLLAPLAAGAGGVFAWAWGRTDLASLTWGLAALALVGLYAWAGHTRAWSLHLRVELAASGAWALGTLAWSQHALDAATLGWLAFLVGTIAAERRELMQFVRLPRWARTLFLLLALAGAAAVLGAMVSTRPGAGQAESIAPQALWWATCAALALWLLRWDIAPRQWRRAGWLGHTGQCLTVGYLWLLAGALLSLGGLVGLLRPEGAALAARHAVLLGFVFAMVFGHAPIILPALAGVRPRYTAWARLPIWVLSLSLWVRLAAMETGSLPALAWAGALHAAALVVFAVAMGHAVWRGRARLPDATARAV